MQKAIFSRIDLNNADNDLAEEYLGCISDLLHLDGVQDLKAFTQHMNTSRFQHSLNVSYYTFLIARRFHLDSCSAARAGLLHDQLQTQYTVYTDSGQLQQRSGVAESHEAPATDVI